MLRFEWIIPIIVTILWIIGQVVKAREEAEGKANPKPVGPRGNTELDRFLEEIERLRRERAGMSAKEYEEQQDDDDEEEEIKQQPVSRPVIVQAPTIVLREVPTAVRRPDLPRPAVVVPPPVQPRPAARSAPAASAPTFRRSRSVVSTVAMLRNPQSIASAIMLQEVLGPPKCRR